MERKQKLVFFLVLPTVGSFRITVNLVYVKFFWINEIALTETNFDLWGSKHNRKQRKNTLYRPLTYM